MKRAVIAACTFVALLTTVHAGNEPLALTQAKKGCLEVERMSRKIHPERTMLEWQQLLDSCISTEMRFDCELFAERKIAQLGLTNFCGALKLREQ